MFVDSTALLEQVTDDVVSSAFKSAGQRCSALRVLYLQDEIADAATGMIRGAMDTLNLGDPRDMATDIGPIIDAPAAKSLADHIAALKAKNGPRHATPMSMDGGSFIAPHMFEIQNIDELSDEHFGPVLHVIRYKSAKLEETLTSAFATGYGLTLGVHTRMDRQWVEIFEKAPIGNTYINRNMTGAVVGSQPFGGHGLSGTGFKAGGPRYLHRFAVERTCSVNTTAAGGNASFQACDVSDWESMRGMVDAVASANGGVDIMCANAGAFPQTKIVDMDPTEWDQVMATNLKSSFLCVKAAIPHFDKGGKGRVVLTSSITGPVTGFPGWSHYGASKSGQLGFLKTAAMELSRYNTTINAVMPGNIFTEGLQDLGEDYLKTMAASIPLKRLGAVEDIGNAALFFASDEAGYITGQQIVVDGGQILPESLEAIEEI